MRSNFSPASSRARERRASGRRPNQLIEGAASGPRVRSGRRTPQTSVIPLDHPVELRTMPNGKVLLTGGSPASAMDLVMTLEDDGTVCTRGFTRALPTHLRTRAGDEYLVIEGDQCGRPVQVNVKQFHQIEDVLPPHVGAALNILAPAFKATVLYILSNA